MNNLRRIDISQNSDKNSTERVYDFYKIDYNTV